MTVEVRTSAIKGRNGDYVIVGCPFVSGLELTLTSCKKVLCNIKKHIDKFGFEVYTYIKKF